jgi:hypothetical protein
MKKFKIRVRVSLIGDKGRRYSVDSTALFSLARFQVAHWAPSAKKQLPRFVWRCSLVSSFALGLLPPRAVAHRR